jgi:hypothetical protein
MTTIYILAALWLVAVLASSVAVSVASGAIALVSRGVPSHDRTTHTATTLATTLARIDNKVTALVSEESKTATA